MLVDIALWLRSSSPAPDIVAYQEVDPCLTTQEAVLAFMYERREPYADKAAIKTPYGYERFSRLSLPLDAPFCQVSAREVSDALWLLVETYHLDPVEVPVDIALGLVRDQAADDPTSLFGYWCQFVTAPDERLFADFWNNRRSAEARRRLWLSPESEVSDGNPA